jgi:hypothetical protein
MGVCHGGWTAAAALEVLHAGAAEVHPPSLATSTAASQGCVTPPPLPVGRELGAHVRHVVAHIQSGADVADHASQAVDGACLLTACGAACGAEVDPPPSRCKWHAMMASSRLCKPSSELPVKWLKRSAAGSC